jgi:mono/diheme cytochrome c family protein
MRKAAAALIILAAMAAGLVLFVRRGFSTRTSPSAPEAWIATTLRELSIPRQYKDMRNPLDCSPEALAAAKEHWADHCATCHANNGTGESMLGKTMYPRPPDMRQPPTQLQSDGELYYTINNGVRLSGMPAFGPAADPSGDNANDSWKLVCFIRHLPKLTPAELDEMQKLNPKTPGDLEEERQEAEFLNGGAAAPAEDHHHHH